MDHDGVHESACLIFQNLFAKDLQDFGV